LAQREARVICEAGGDLRLENLNGREELARPFLFKVTLTSADHNLALLTLLGTGMTVELDTHGGKVRHFLSRCRCCLCRGGWHPRPL